MMKGNDRDLSVKTEYVMKGITIVTNMNHWSKL